MAKDSKSAEELVLQKINEGIPKHKIFGSLRRSGIKKKDVDSIVEAFYMSSEDAFDLVRRRVQVITLRGLEAINNDLHDIPVEKMADTLMKAKKLANDLPTSITINNKEGGKVELTSEERRTKLIASLTAPKPEMKNVN